MSKAIEDLKHEHEAITSALQILDKMVQRYEADASGNPDDILKFSGFLKEFTDKCHHGKEEGILFPALTAAGIPEKDGPIGVMLAEHVEGRRLIKEMEDAVLQTPNLPKFIESARQYQSLLRNHIQKENNVLFPMAEKVLQETQMDRIFDSFEEHEEKVIGHGRHEELHAVLKALKKKYES